MSHALAKYLATYAEPEAARVADVPGGYAGVLVVPACREEVSLLNGFEEAARACAGRVLCILVVNGRSDAAAGVHTANDRLLADVRGRVGSSLRRICGVPPMYLGDLGAFDILVVDRATVGHRFLRKQGVGLARKIGADIAVALHRAEKTNPWIGFSDADATLPAGYFDALRAASPDVSAVLFSFWHAPSGDPPVDVATALYEVSLRYYVLGLARAGSPYAMHTLGSAMAVSAVAYASARGVPKREAAEDFYLLNKIAKVGTVLRVDDAVVELRARRSERTPFGTGCAVDRMLADPESLRLYGPECFDVLGSWLHELEEFCAHLSVERLLATTVWAGRAAGVVLDAVEHAGGRTALERIVRQSHDATDLWTRLHIWFDAFRTLKLIHALRDAHFAPVPWREAIARIGFESARGDDVTVLRHRLRCREQDCPSVVGPLSVPQHLRVADSVARAEMAKNRPAIVLGRRATVD